MPSTLVAGRLDPDSTTDTEHYWSVDLEAGIHHLVLENRLASGTVGALGLQVATTDASGAVLETLSRGNRLDYRMRELVTLTLDSAQTLTLRVTPNSSRQVYTMGVFPNGMPVPSPYFDNCPSIAPLSIGTTEAFTLATSDTVEDAQSSEVWFRTELDVADYTLAVDTVVASGARTNIIFAVTSHEQFGQVDRSETVITANVLDTASSSSGDILSSDPVPRWIRFRNAKAPLEVTTTLARK